MENGNRLEIPKSLFDRINQLIDLSDIVGLYENETPESNRHKIKEENRRSKTRRKAILQKCLSHDDSGFEEFQQVERKLRRNIEKFVKWMNSWLVTVKMDLETVENHLKTDLSRCVGSQRDQYDRYTQLSIKDMFDEINEVLKPKIAPFKYEK